MLLTDLLADFKPAYPTSKMWADTFELFESNPFDKEVIQNLLLELVRDGKFREPIVLSVEDNDMDEEDKASYEPYVMNGTHRVYAYYLAGYETVFAQQGWQVANAEEMYGDDWTAYPETISVFSLKTAVTDERSDDIIECLRSFKLSEKVWLTSDLVVSTYTVFTVSWSGIELDEKLLQEINEAASSRLLALLPDHEFVMKTATVFNKAEYDFLHAEIQNW